MKNKIFRIILKISFIPYILIFIYGILLECIFGFKPLEFAIAMLKEFLWDGIGFGKIIILFCLIYQIIYFIFLRKKYKENN